MYARFARTLSQLRHEKGVSQREAAQALEVSQALLSHYENASGSRAWPLWSGPVTITKYPPTICWVA